MLNLRDFIDHFRRIITLLLKVIYIDLLIVKETMFIQNIAAYCEETIHMNQINLN